MHNLKKEYLTLTNPTRGIYQLILSDTEGVYHYTELNSSIAVIEKTLDDCKNFKWYSCSESELDAERIKVNVLLKLSNTITLTLK